MQLKEFLQENHVSYQLKEVDKDPEARAYLGDVLKSRGVPTTVIGDRVIVGFQVEALKEALGLR